MGVACVRGETCVSVLGEAWCLSRFRPAGSPARTRPRFRPRIPARRRSAPARHRSRVHRHERLPTWRASPDSALPMKQPVQAAPMSSTTLNRSGVLLGTSALTAIYRERWSCRTSSAAPATVRPTAAFPRAVPPWLAQCPGGPTVWTGDGRRAWVFDSGGKLVGTASVSAAPDAQGCTARVEGQAATCSSGASGTVTLCGK